MSAGPTHPGLPVGITRISLLKLIKSAFRLRYKFTKPTNESKPYQLSPRALAMLEYCIQHTRDADYIAGRPCGIWPSAETLAAELGYEIRSINDAEHELAEAGLIQLNNGRGRRCGQREAGAEGAIVWFRGISLAPLINQAAKLGEEIEMLKQAVAMRKEAVRQAREQIRDLRQRARLIGGDAWDAAEAILPGGRVSKIKNLDKLATIADAMQATTDMVDPKLGQQKSADRSAEDCAHTIQTERMIEPCSAQRKRAVSIDRFSIQQALTVATPEFRRRFAVHRRVGWREMEETSWSIALDHGIQLKTWKSMCRQWTPAVAALTVLLIDRNAHLPDDHPYQAKSFARCLAGLAKDPTSLPRMFRAAVACPDQRLIDRVFEPELAIAGSREGFGAACVGALANFQILEDTYA